jgi:hypothetical protein
MLRHEGLKAIKSLAIGVSAEGAGHKPGVFGWIWMVKA